jgi:hypothetical protein
MSDLLQNVQPLPPSRRRNRPARQALDVLLIAERAPRPGQDQIPGLLEMESVVRALAALLQEQER